MTSITIPEQMDEKPVDGKTSPTNGMFCVFCVLSSLITLLVLAAFTWYIIIVDTVPSCSDDPSSIRSTDVNFNRRGKLYGTDVEFKEDFQYDHAKNTLISRLAAINDQGGHHARMDNATIIHDFTRGVTARVLPTHKKCYLGELDFDDSLNLPLVTDGDVQNLQSAWPSARHHYMTMGPIAPEYLARTAGPVVRDYCSGLQTSWIAQTPTSNSGAVNPDKKRAVPELAEIWTVIGLPDGTVISDMTNRALLKMYGHI